MQSGKNFICSTGHYLRIKKTIVMSIKFFFFSLPILSRDNYIDGLETKEMREES